LLPDDSGTRSPHIAGKGGSAVTVHTQVNLDGRKVAEAVTQRQTQALGAPQTGIDIHDSRSTMEPAGGLGY
jgi:hypothetical protein